MQKEELKDILDNLTIDEIINFQITYKRKYDYGYRSEPEHTISYNKER